MNNLTENEYSRLMSIIDEHDLIEEINNFIQDIRRIDFLLINTLRKSMDNIEKRCSGYKKENISLKNIIIELRKGNYDKN